MRKLAFIFFLFWASLFGTNKCLAGQIYSLQYHKNWTSFILQGDTMSAVRISTYAKGVSLSLDFYQDNMYMFFMTCPSNGIPDTKEPSSFLSEMRIDKNKIYSVNTSYYIKDGQIFLNISVPNNNFIQEAIYGSFVRFKIMTPYQPFYLKFSLIGFTSAFNRAIELCKEIYKNYTPEEEFFRRSTPQKQSFMDSDGAYFL